jgi:hypothetical protein
MKNTPKGPAKGPAPDVSLSGVTTPRLSTCIRDTLETGAYARVRASPDSAACSRLARIALATCVCLRRCAGTDISPISVPYAARRPVAR